MRDCTSCRFDVKAEVRELSVCREGHARNWSSITKGIEIIPIQDCHAWQEKGKCDCNYCLDAFQNTSDVFKGIYNIKCKKCGREIT